MLTTDKQHIAFLADFCAQNGVQHLVISPGSRNAPLVIAFENHPSVKTHLIHDERSAAFFALGLSESLGEIVALTCTSGSALLNYSPAIVEAYYRQIPLLVLSADRPEHLIDQGDGQTIRQKDVYSNFVKKSFTFPEEGDNLLDLALKQCSSILSELKNYPLGPVHVNVPLAEPLYNTASFEKFDVEIVERNVEVSPPNELINEIGEIWKTAEKKLIIVGQHFPNKQLEAIIQAISADGSVAVLVENTSNIQDFKSFCHCIDRTLEAIPEEELEAFAPDLLISIGGAVISKRIKAYFRNFKPKHNWRIGQFLIQEDTYQSLSKTIRSNPVPVLEYLVGMHVPPNSNFGGLWKQKDLEANERHNSFLQNAPYSDLKVFDTLIDLLPEDSVLHMGNSSVVRYCQLFNPIKSFAYFSNRGVSGIDGSGSTAAGFSCSDPSKLNVLVSGDISFFYDSNAFWNNALTGNLKVIVISNGGGGIFEIIPGPAQSEQSQTFFAPTSASVEGICSAYDLNYYSASNLDEISKSVEEFFSIPANNRPSVLEISTQNADNSRVLADYFNSLNG